MCMYMYMCHFISIHTEPQELSVQTRRRPWKQWEKVVGLTRHRTWAQRPEAEAALRSLLAP